MGTWGARPFESDTAEDYLEELVSLSELTRLEFVAQTFRSALADIQSATMETLPEEVIAAAAVVAANLPSGEGFPWNEDVPGITRFLPRPVSSEVRAMAIEALDAVFPTDGWWWRSWVDSTEKSEAQEAHDSVKRALRGG